MTTSSKVDILNDSDRILKMFFEIVFPFASAAVLGQPLEGVLLQITKSVKGARAWLIKTFPKETSPTKR